MPSRLFTITDLLTDTVLTSMRVLSWKLSLVILGTGVGSGVIFGLLENSRGQRAAVFS